jgi:hypothetical protein
MLKKGYMEMKLSFRVLMTLMVVSLFAGSAYGRDDEDVAVSELIKQVAGLSPCDQNAVVKPLLYGQRFQATPDFTALAKLGPRVVPLVGFAVGAYTMDSKTGKAIIERIGDKAIEPIRKLLGDDNTDPRIIGGLLQIAGELGSTAQPFVPELLDLLGDAAVDASPSRRFWLRKVLSGLKLPAGGLLSAVRRVLKEGKREDLQFQRQVIYLFREVEKPDEQTIAFLIDLLKTDTTGPIRDAAGDVLVFLRADAKRVVPVLLRNAAAADASWGRRKRALDAIGEFGSSAKAFYADVLKAAEASDDADDKCRFLLAAGRIGPEKDVAKLLHGIIKDDGKYALSAQIIYIRRFPSDKKALDALAQWAAKATNHYQFASAVKLFGELAAGGNKPAGEVLLDLLEKTKPDPKRSEKLLEAFMSSTKPSEAHLKLLLGHYLVAEDSMPELGAAFRPFETKAVAQLLAASDSADRKQKHRIDKLLASFSIDATVPLAEALTLGKVTRQHVAARALKTYSEISPKAVPFLRKALISKNQMSVIYAMIALKKLGPKGSGAAEDVWPLVLQVPSLSGRVLDTYLAIASDDEKKLTELVADKPYMWSSVCRIMAMNSPFYDKLWTAAVTSDTSRVRVNAIGCLSRALYPGRSLSSTPDSLGWSGPSKRRKEIAATLVKLVERGLGDEDPWMRRLAFNCVGGLAHECPDWAKAKLRTALRSNDKQLIDLASGGLSAAQDVLALTVEERIKVILNTKYDYIKTSLSHGMRRTKPLGADAAPKLIANLNHAKDNPYAARAAAIALGAMGTDAAGAVEPIIEILRNKPRGGHLRNTLIETLGKLGPAGQTALADLYVEQKMPSSLSSAIGRGSPNPPLAKLLEAKANQAKSTSQAKKLRDLASRIEGNPKTHANKQALQAFVKKNYADLMKTSN